jgi:prepilin-type N-terminal cleavage/methylation domain-containing protein
MQKKKNAFTLAELLIVVVIIGILAGIGMIRYGNVLESARQAEAYSVLAEIVSAENRYFLDSNGSYTTTITDLDCFSTDNDPSVTSNNFNFGVTLSDGGYAEAIREVGTSSYGMCLNGGKRKDCPAADVCNPGCT